jgi:hypothetical protein
MRGIQKMKPRVTKLWVEALRSGEYEQGVDHFCVFGVLCDLHAQKTGDGWEGDGSWLSYQDVSLGVPYAVAAWADLTPDVQHKLMRMNDHDAHSFEYLADWVEKYL